MINNFKYKKFVESAIAKQKVTWSEIENYFGEGFLDTEDFDSLLYKLDEEGVKVKNDFVEKKNEDEVIFESYVDFENPEKIVRREEVGGKTELEPNEKFKEYLINAHLIMNYDLKSISRIYGISAKILEDWVFAYENNYEPVVPHCYFSTEMFDDIIFSSFNSYQNISPDAPNSFYIGFDYETPEGIKRKFTELYKRRNMTNDEIAIALKIYPSLVEELKTELRNINKQDYFYKKALNKIPMWAQKPYQDNHKIIRAYFKAYHRFDEPPTKNMMQEICSNYEDQSCYVNNFQATYSSLKADGPNTNGKLFIDDGTYVQIWEEIEDVLLKYEKYFYDNE